jgi:hypothetical protein
MPHELEDIITTAHLINSTTSQDLYNRPISTSIFIHLPTNPHSKMSTSHISTPLNGVDAAVVIAALHNHELMIKTLCPALVSYAFDSGDKATSATYTVTDKKPIGQVRLPFHHFPTSSLNSHTNLAKTTYKLTLTNVPTGVDSLVNAKPPVGTLTIAGKWRVDGGKLTEDVEIDGNFMMKKMAKGNVEKTHPEQHTKLLEAAKA